MHKYAGGRWRRNIFRIVEDRIRSKGLSDKFNFNERQNDRGKEDKANLELAFFVKCQKVREEEETVRL